LRVLPYVFEVGESVKIEANLRKYLDQRKPNARSSSFDYCFNYFQSYREGGDVSVMSSRENMELSCLQLGFYLASWGMLRASSVLLQKSVRHYAQVIEAIASMDPDVWEIDAHCYTEQNIAILQEVAVELRAALLNKADGHSRYEDHVRSVWQRSCIRYLLLHGLRRRDI
jgi:hypothetical protein